MPREHENQANQHGHQKNRFIKRSISAAGDVCFGSKADIEAHSCDVRFTPKSGHCGARLACPLCAKSGHSALQQKYRLFDHFVGSREKGLRYRESERPERPPVDE